MEAIVGIVFGTLMLAIGLVGLFQSHRGRLRQSAYVQSLKTSAVADRFQQSMKRCCCPLGQDIRMCQISRRGLALGGAVFITHTRLC